MKKRLLMAAAAIAIAGFALPSYSATTATVSGQLDNVTTITGHDSSGSISSSTGAYTPSGSQPSFTFVTNSDVDLYGILTSAPVSSAATLGEYNSAVRIALTNTSHTATQGAVENAMGYNSATPTPADNANVIAYAISATGNYTSATAFAWTGGDFKGQIFDYGAAAPGDTVNVTIGTPDTSGTFSIADLAGSYTAVLTLTAGTS